MVSSPINNPVAPAVENVREYFRLVAERCQLPPIPVVARKVLKMIENPDVNMQELCRVLYDDVALTGRILAVSRSPYYAQRKLPTTLVQAVQVLGFRTLRSVALTSAIHSLRVKGNKVSEKLWNHSLGVALATRILSKRASLRDGDQAFLAGLMHDVGEMVLMYGDPRGFGGLIQEVEQSQCKITDKEQQAYGFDHTLVGSTLLNYWNIDSQIGQAVLHHHSNSTSDNTEELAAIVTAADHLCFKADLGFFGEPPKLDMATMVRCQCDDDQRAEEIVQEIRAAYEEESALFRPA